MSESTFKAKGPSVAHLQITDGEERVRTLVSDFAQKVQDPDQDFNVCLLPPEETHPP